MTDLYEEATMSIEELIMRYGKHIKESSEDSEGNSKRSSIELISKLCAKGRKSKVPSAGAEKVVESSKNDGESPTEEKENIKLNTVHVKECEPSEKSEPTDIKTDQSENEISKVTTESNGKCHNGSNNHENDHTKQTEIPVSVKGKGIGKGLSNSIRKVVEKTPEEIELELREAEKVAKRQERKKSLRCKTADELYK